jgi:hypothetical protein
MPIGYPMAGSEDAAPWTPLAGDEETADACGSDAEARPQGSDRRFRHLTAARPVAVVGTKLEHEIEQLHRSCDFRFGHWA